MGIGTWVYQDNQVTYELPASQCNVSNEEVWMISELPGVGLEFSFHFIESENKLVMRFPVVSNAILDLERIRYDLDLDPLQTIQIAKNIFRIAEYFTVNKELSTVFHPCNFYVHPEQGTIQILYRGLRGRMPAVGFEEEHLLDQGKRLVFLLFTSARYEELLLNGNETALRYAIEGFRMIVRRLLYAQTFEEAQLILDEEESTYKKKENEAQIYNNNTKNNGWMKKLPSFSVIPKYMPNEFLEGLRAAAIQDYEKAIEFFQKVDFARLDPEDQQIILKTYLFAGKPEEVERFVPSFFNQMDQMPNLSPILRFEIAAYRRSNYATILRLREQVPMDSRRQRIVLEAQIAREKGGWENS